MGWMNNEFGVVLHNGIEVIRDGENVILFRNGEFGTIRISLDAESLKNLIQFCCDDFNKEEKDGN